MDSHKTLCELIQHHPIDTNAYENCKLDGIVNYKSPIKSATTKIDVRFIHNGYDDGKFELGEQPEVKPENYHLDLIAMFQDYKLVTSRGKLVIS